MASKTVTRVIVAQTSYVSYQMLFIILRSREVLNDGANFSTENLAFLGVDPLKYAEKLKNGLNGPYSVARENHQNGFFQG